MSYGLLLKYGDFFICSNRLFALLLICQSITKLLMFPPARAWIGQSPGIAV